MQSMKRQLDRLLYVFTFCCETIHHEKQKTLVGGWWVGMRFEGDLTFGKKLHNFLSALIDNVCRRILNHLWIRSE